MSAIVGPEFVGWVTFIIVALLGAWLTVLRIREQRVEAAELAERERMDAEELAALEREEESVGVPYRARVDSHRPIEPELTRFRE